MKKKQLLKKKKIKIKWPQIAHHSSRIRAHRVHHRPLYDYDLMKKSYILKKYKKYKNYKKYKKMD